MSRGESFSQKVKKELCTVEQDNFTDKSLHLAFSLASSASFRSHKIIFKCYNSNYIELIKSYIDDILDVDYILEEKKTQSTFEFSSKVAVKAVFDLLETELDFNWVRGQINRDIADFNQEERIDILRSAFLMNGSMACPEQSYQLELALKRLSVKNFLNELLLDENIEVSTGSNAFFLYLRTGDDIAEFLGLIGAHKSLLEFENIRVKKKVNEDVNRIVNFDNANLQRVADSTARQILALKKLNDIGAYQMLPEDLKEVANLRLQFPGYSLSDLAAEMEPSISKSGMYHRLAKLEKWINDYLKSNAD